MSLSVPAIHEGASGHTLRLEQPRTVKYAPHPGAEVRSRNSDNAR